jgi:hypothetical protein
MNFNQLFSFPCVPSLVPVAAALLLAPASTEAAVTVIGFEGFADLGTLTTEIPGLVLTNATVLNDGGSLNSPMFPPFSGIGVISNSGNPLAIDFSIPVSTVGGYFTYAEALTLSFYGAGNVLLGTVPSTYSQNYVGTGNPPNEFIQFSSPAGIARMEVGATQEFTFTLDNLTFPAASAVPEPASAMVNFILGGTGIGLTLRRRRR